MQLKPRLEEAAVIVELLQQELQHRLFYLASILTGWKIIIQHLVEKTIEAETPAHIHTRVVWLGIEQMKKFEQVYNAWLQEMAQTEIPTYEIVNPFIETINKLQPCGSCKDEC